MALFAQNLERIKMKKILLYIIFAITLTAKAQEAPQCIEETTKTENNKVYKESAHASYYHDKFNGRKTASGKRFDNNKLTAAHKKLPFGTKLKITNEFNKKSVIVEVTDRGPFVNGREIDLSKKAFMDIASNKKSGAMNVTIEIIEK
ncbi:rare lipoprotein A [Flavobacterium araucananum]|nr:rare lipoprotein A [Flavobacterium araucananum]